MTMAQRLRDLIATGVPVQAPGAADPLAARLVERTGFPAVYMTGFGATAVRLGEPDLGLLTQTEMAEHARNMVRAVGVPVIADADNGYGGPSNIERTVREYLQAGVAALHLEDQLGPKRCGHMAGVKLMDPVLAARHIEAAIEARGDADMLILARTDALGVLGMDEAIARVERYQDAGADMLFVDGVKRISEAEEIAKRVSGPKVLSLVAGSEAEQLTIDDIRELGFSLVFYSLDTLFAATKAISDALQSLRTTGRSLASPASLSYDQFQEIVGLAHHQSLDNRFGG